jgi:predicted TIM-barrel fold metal-dependent hydrolase
MNSEIVEQDKFVAMVTARAQVDLPISDFYPVSEVRAEQHLIERPRFPVVDYHNHLDSLEPEHVLDVMDRTGVEKIVNITMKTGDAAHRILRRYREADRERFHSIGWMDWTDVTHPDFVARTFERLEALADLGACGIKFWKDFGLTLTNADGSLIQIDDDRYAPIFDKAAKLGMAVMFHTADPAAFFKPIDAHNERYEELAAHPDWAFSGVPVEKWTLLEARNRVFARHPDVTFVGAHVGESGEDLAFVRRMLTDHPNVVVDISARTPELGRQPYTARKLFLDFPDRMVFGTDLLPEVEMYRQHYRFLETDDEYFDYPSHASRQGRWSIYGLYLPDDILEKVYRQNALKLLHQA